MKDSRGHVPSMLVVPKAQENTLQWCRELVHHQESQSLPVSIGGVRETRCGGQNGAEGGQGGT